MLKWCCLTAIELRMAKSVWAKVQEQSDAPTLTNHAALMWSRANAGTRTYAPIREHGLSEAELMNAYSVDIDDKPSE